WNPYWLRSARRIAFLPTAKRKRNGVDLGLKNKVAIIAGSSEGMGRAAAEAFAAAGANVALCARTEKKLNAAAEEIRKAHKVEVFAQPVDVTDFAAVEGFVAAVAKKFGRIDVCVAIAGWSSPQDLLFIYLDVWRHSV